MRFCQGTEHPAIRNVAQAYIQGLAANLAFFLAKSGQQAHGAAKSEVIGHRSWQKLLFGWVVSEVTDRLFTNRMRPWLSNKEP